MAAFIQQIMGASSTPYASTYKYKSAPQKKFCGSNGCYTNSSTAQCTGDPVIGPKGYSFVDDGGVGLGCFMGTKLNIWEKNPNDPHWNPLPEKMGANTGRWSDKDVADANACCSNSVLTDAGKKNCGTFLWEGSGDTPPTCKTMLNKWCKYEDNIIKPECKPLIQSSEEFKKILKQRCPAKQGFHGWGDICACYMDYSHYDDLANYIEKNWEGPTGKISRIAECIDPQCAASPYKDVSKYTKCPEVSFSKCGQIADASLKNSHVKKFTIKQECNIGAKGWSKKNVSNNSSKDGDNDLTQKEKDALDKHKPSTRSPMEKLMLLLFFLVVISLPLGAIYYIIKDEDEEKRASSKKASSKKATSDKATSDTW
jgi:hypothetical protein